MKRSLPKRTYLKHGAWYYIDMQRKWHRLCAVSAGLPSMYRALAHWVEEGSLRLRNAAAA